MIEHSETATDWLRILPKGNSIESVVTQNTVVSLLASKNGTEIIHHSLSKGGTWGLSPEEGWDELEAVIVLSGKLRVRGDNLDRVLDPTDFLSASPVSGYVYLTALEDSSFVYICSNYIFQHYSEVTRKFKHMAVEIEEKDGYTARHCERIRRNSVMIGEQMGLRSTDLFALSCGAFFHDIGKINIPDKILLKPGRLTEEEFDIIKKHTIFGKEILTATGIPYFISGSRIAEQHHERYDGSGYPFGLKENQIDTGAAIVAVVDSYDAMTSNRPYQSAKTKSDAVSEISALSGKLYHPKVVEAFLSLVERFPD